MTEDDRLHADERLLRDALAADDASASPAAIAALARRASQPVRPVETVELVLVLLATVGATVAALVMGAGAVAAVLTALGISNPVGIVVTVAALGAWLVAVRRRTVRLLEDRPGRAGGAAAGPHPPEHGPPRAARG